MVGAQLYRLGSGMSVTYYHAGPRCLSAILPPITTGAASTASYGASRVCRRDRVYVTTDLDCAVAFASAVPPNGAGWVYVVNPVDPQPDPDCFEPGLSFEARSAAIISIIRPTGKQLKKGRQRLRSMA